MFVNHHSKHSKVKRTMLESWNDVIDPCNVNKTPVPLGEHFVNAMVAGDVELNRVVDNLFKS